MFDNDANYARTRIIGTWMLPKEKEKGLHLLIDIVASNNNLKTAKLVLATTKKQSVNDVGIDFLQFNVGSAGYVKDRYLARMPLRNDWRQGLRYNQLIEVKAGNYDYIGENWFNTNIDDISNAVINKYKPFDKVLEQVEELGFGQGFSKHFAVARDYKLLYKGQMVGKISVKDKPELDSNYEFLTQELRAVTHA